jgi:hypothetical protein
MKKLQKDGVLQLDIQTDKTKEIELITLSNSMVAFNNLYYDYLKRNPKNEKSEYKLYVDELKTGSIILHIFEIAPHVLPNIPPQLYSFMENFITILDFLSSKTKDNNLSIKLNINMLRNIKIFITLIKDSDGKLNIVLPFGKQIINNNYTTEDSLKISDRCDKEIKKIQESGDSIIKEKVYLKLYQARNSNLSLSNAGNIGIIEEISKIPIVLSFVNDRLKYDITKGETNPFNYIYIVDIEIKFKDETKGYNEGRNITEYIILKLHGSVEEKDLFNK